MTQEIQTEGIPLEISIPSCLQLYPQPGHHAASMSPRNPAETPKPPPSPPEKFPPAGRPASINYLSGIYLPPAKSSGRKSQTHK